MSSSKSSYTCKEEEEESRRELLVECWFLTISSLSWTPSSRLGPQKLASEPREHTFVRSSVCALLLL